MDETEQNQQLCPGAEALVHGVRVERGILAQAPVETGEGIVADEGLVLRQHAALFGIEEKDQAKDDGKQASVDVVAVAVGGERLAQQLPAGRVVGGLEPAEQLILRVHHLLRKALADFVLVLAAVCQESGETLVPGQAQQPLFVEEKPQRGAEGTPGGQDQVAEAEVHPAGTLAAGR